MSTSITLPALDLMHRGLIYPVGNNGCKWHLIPFLCSFRVLWSLYIIENSGLPICWDEDNWEMKNFLDFKHFQKSKRPRCSQDPRRGWCAKGSQSTSMQKQGRAVRFQGKVTAGTFARLVAPTCSPLRAHKHPSKPVGEGTLRQMCLRAAGEESQRHRGVCWALAAPRCCVPSVCGNVPSGFLPL